MRGHSLSRNMYGLNYLIEADGRIKRNSLGEVGDANGQGLNDLRFNATGRQHNPVPPFPGPAAQKPNDDFNLINYTYFAADTFLRDPERRGWRPGLRPPGKPDQPHPLSGGFNATYTYPALNNMFRLAEA